MLSSHSIGHNRQCPHRSVSNITLFSVYHPTNVHRCTVFSLKLICKMYISRFFIAFLFKLLLLACREFWENKTFSSVFITLNLSLHYSYYPFIPFHWNGINGDTLSTNDARAPRIITSTNKQSPLEASCSLLISHWLLSGSLTKFYPLCENEARIGESNSLRIARFVYFTPAHVIFFIYFLLLIKRSFPWLWAPLPILDFPFWPP